MELEASPVNWVTPQDVQSIQPVNNGMDVAKDDYHDYVAVRLLGVSQR